MKKLDVNG